MKSGIRLKGTFFSSESADLRALYAAYEQEASALLEAVVASLAQIP
jgi:hypothetical protein